ncbi:MAG: hypothetical protein V4623_10655 [Pseudomonadota bacterium]
METSTGELCVQEPLQQNQQTLSQNIDRERSSYPQGCVQAALVSVSLELSVHEMPRYQQALMASLCLASGEGV